MLLVLGIFFEFIYELNFGSTMVQTDKYIFAVTVIYTLLVIGLYILIGKISTIRKRRVIKKQNAKVLAKLPIGFYLCIADILVLIYSIIV